VRPKYGEEIRREGSLCTVSTDPGKRTNWKLSGGRPLHQGFHKNNGEGKTSRLILIKKVQQQTGMKGKKEEVELEKRGGIKKEYKKRRVSTGKTKRSAQQVR